MNEGTPFKKDAFQGNDSLAQAVMSRFQRSVQFKQTRRIGNCSVAQWEEKLELAYNKVYTKADKDDVEGECFYFGLINLKVNATTSWLYDLLASREDSPFTVSPTPVPSLPKKTIDEVSLDLVARVEKRIRDAGGAPSDLVSGVGLDPRVKRWVREQAAAMKQTKMQALRARAQAGANAAQVEIEDMMVEGKFRQAMAAFYHDFALYPEAFLRGPVWRPQNVLEWKGGTLKPNRKLVPEWYCVRPKRAFPAPDARSAQDGGWFIELSDLSMSDLSDMKLSEYANAKNIDAVLQRVQANGTSWLTEPIVDPMLAANTRSSTRIGESIEVVIHEGRFSGAECIKYGVPGVKVGEFYEVEAWVVSGSTVFARAVPTENGTRTYYSAHYAGSTDQIYDQSIGTMLYEQERELNLYVRSRAKNVRKASGPMLEAPMNRFDRPTQLKIKPWTLIFTRPEIAGSPGSSIKMHEFRLHSGELTALIRDCLSRADDLCGIPAMFYANPQVFGSLRTSGGIAMLFGAALKGIKLGVANIDMNVIEPTVTNVWTHLMVHSKNKDIKQDARIVARGASGIIEKQLRANKLEEKIAPILQAAGPEAIPKEFARALIYQSFKNDGLPIDLYMDDPTDPSLASLPGISGAGTSTPPAITATPGGVSLDGRSKVMSDVL